MKKLESQANTMHKDLIDIVVFSSGAFSWNDVWGMSAHDREVAAKSINVYNELKAGKEPNEYM
jgi:hypothetical protein